MQRDSLRDERNDVGEADLTVEETLDGDFIRRVQHHRIGAARFGGAASDRNRRIPDLVDRLECQGAKMLDLQSRQAYVDPLRVHEGVHYGESHIWYGQLRLDGSIGEFDERVDDALSVEDNGYFCLRNAEEPARLDDLQPFVHQGSRIHGDLRAHRPGRMLQ